jgi:hypothetical protein
MPTTARGQKRWAESAERRLGAVMLAALRVRVALEVARDSPHPANILEDAGAPLLIASADLLTWLQRSAVPPRTELAVAELHAAAGVFRNAAVVYPGAADVGDSREARTTACSAMLDQGEHHVAMFRALIAKEAKA